MHRTFFGIKRVHLRVVEVTRPMVAEYGLTPARFDLMRVVLLQEDGIPQGTLRWMLGVSAPTVSRMLKSLQEIGYVERERDVADGRCLIVRLTPRGITATRMGLEATVVNQEANRTAARGVTANTRIESASADETKRTMAAGRDKLRDLDGLLDNMRKAFDDRAPFPHPWRAGDFEPLVFTTIVGGRIRYGDEDLLAELSA